MQEKVSKRGEAFLKRFNSAQDSLRKGIKTFNSDIQTEVDKTTEFLYQYLKKDIAAIRAHRLETYNQELYGILVPEVTISASDLAPKYGLKIQVEWCLYGKVVVSPKELDISGQCMILQAREVPEALNLENKLKQVMEHGITVSLAVPKKKRRKLVDALIKKHKLIDRFCGLTSNYSDIFSH